MSYMIKHYVYIPTNLWGVQCCGHLLIIPLRNFSMVVFSASEKSEPDNFIQIAKKPHADLSLFNGRFRSNAKDSKKRSAVLISIIFWSFFSFWQSLIHCLMTGVDPAIVADSQPWFAICCADLLCKPWCCKYCKINSLKLVSCCGPGDGRWLCLKVGTDFGSPLLEGVEEVLWIWL